ncbi:hypothetical protein D3C83_75430 [compost metagenome]
MIGERHAAEHDLAGAPTLLVRFFRFRLLFFFERHLRRLLGGAGRRRAAHFLQIGVDDAHRIADRFGAAVIEP